MNAMKEEMERLQKNLEDAQHEIKVAKKSALEQKAQSMADKDLHRNVFIDNLALQVKENLIVAEIRVGR